MPNPSDHHHGLIFRIKKFAVHDGPGIRTTIFLKGCPLDCWWCHNPEGRDPNPETMVSEKSGAKPDLIGTTWSVDALVREIEKDLIFYDDSGGGVTFSGGEPLFQYEFVHQIAGTCRQRGIHTALDTSGYASEPALDAIVSDIDLFLFDLKLFDNEKHERYTGVSNRAILRNFSKVAEAGKDIHVRFPIIPGITDSWDNIRDIAQFVASFSTIGHLDLLPYHNIGSGKYQRLGKNNRMAGVAPLEKESVSEIKHYFESRGFRVTIGG